MERGDLELWKAREVARLLSLVENERRYYRDLITALPVPLAVLAPDRQIISVNRAFRRLFHLRRDDLAAKPIEQIVPSNRLVEKIRSAHVESVGPPLFEQLGDRLLRIAILPIRSFDDDLEFDTLLLVEDVTDLSAGRTPIAPVPQPQPQPAQLDSSVTAERLAALRALSARLAHDLNNPLMVITGYAEELIESLPAGDPRRANVDQILSATQRITDITGQLFDFTRRKAKPAQSVELTALITRTLKTTADFTPAGPVWASADPGQLEEILLAITAGKRLRITCEATGTDARITLHDPSLTLDSAQRAAIFESFLSKEGSAGPGPALSRAYAIIDEWGGEIDVENEAQGGSNIIIHLPAAKPAGIAPVVPIAAPAPQRRTGATILVVDDEPGIRTLVAKILRGERYNVLEAGSHREALEAAAKSKSPVQLLLTDVMLPDRTGRELAEQMHRSAPALKVLYISGFTGDESIPSGDVPPGSQFLQKPFTLGALIGKVRELLGP